MLLHALSLVDGDNDGDDSDIESDEGGDDGDGANGVHAGGCEIDQEVLA
jgi:hypothetical protein